MKIKYLALILALTMAPGLHAMQPGKENIHLAMSILDANIGKFKNLFDSQQATVYDTFDGNPILITALKAHGSITDKSPTAQNTLNVMTLMIQFLLEHGAPLEKTNAKGLTALHVAAEKGLLTFIPLLLQYGANINVQDKNGNTPLHSAINSNIQGVINPTAPKILTTLLEYGALTNIKNNKDLTAYELLVKKRDTLKHKPKIVFDMADTTREKAMQTIHDMIDAFPTHKTHKNLQKIRGRETEKSSTDMRFIFE